MKFSPSKRAQSFTYAFRGILLFLKKTHNSWIQLCFLSATIILGFYFNITSVEWMMIVLASGLVLAAEAFNTAIEIDMDLTSPDYHPHARDTKDVAAGAVLISAFAAVIIGLIIFVPYL